MINALMLAAAIAIAAVIMFAPEYGDVPFVPEECTRESLFLRLDVKTKEDRAKVTALCQEFHRLKQ